MLRGGATLAIGWAVMLIVGLWAVYYNFRKDNKKDDRAEMYDADGRPSRKSNIILAIFFAAVAVSLACVVLLT